MHHLEYLALLGACLLITLPLEFFFRAGVYRRPRRLLAVLAVIVVVFGIWDAVAVRAGLWDYDAEAVTGIAFFGLPLEEYCFFLAIPVCALLTYGAIGTVLGRLGRLLRPRGSSAGASTRTGDPRG